MFNATLNAQLTSTDPGARLQGILALCCDLHDELAKTIAGVVLDQLPRAAKASWEAESVYNDEGGYLTSIGQLTVTLLDATTLALPAAIDEWGMAIDTQRDVEGDPAVIEQLDDIRDYDEYMAWLANRTGGDRVVLKQITEALLTYAYAVKEDGWLSWRPIQPTTPADVSHGNTAHSASAAPTASSHNEET